MSVVKSATPWPSFGWFTDGELEAEGGETGMSSIKSHFVSLHGTEIDCDVEFLLCVISH